MERIEVSKWGQCLAVDSDAIASRLVRALPALAALVYPALIWCGASVARPLLVLSLLVPVLCFYVAYLTARTNTYPMARVVAHIGVGAPALFSFLGGWLDFQNYIPAGSVGIWIPLWSLLALIVFLERPATLPSGQAGEGKLARAHGISAAAVTAFAMVHLTNHVLGVRGGTVHMAFMAAARTVYRFPPVEAMLVLCLCFQLASGLVLVGRRLRQPATEWLATVQTAAGAYIFFFFLSHLSAVARTRYLKHTDTNWLWLTSSNLLTDAWSARLTPYYFLGVVALGLHVGSGIYWLLRGRGKSESVATAAFAAIATCAFAVAAVIMAGLIVASGGTAG